MDRLGQHHARRAHRLRARASISCSLGLLLIWASLSGTSSATNISISAQGPSADIRFPSARARCEDQGSGAHHSLTEVSLPGGRVTKLPGVLRVNLDVLRQGGTAFLLPSESHATVQNQRGSIQFELRAGSCADRSLTSSGDQISGSGNWAIDPAYTTDAYAGATGTGTFTFMSTFAEGGSNPWTFDLDGDITVLQPDVSVEVIRSYWGRLGADFAGRTATVIYRITNSGSGHAFGARIEQILTASGIEPVQIVPMDLGDLAPGESIEVRARFRINSAKNKGPLTVGREFLTTLRILLPDALDELALKEIPVTVSAPSFPPPL